MSEIAIETDGSGAAAGGDVVPLALLEGYKVRWDRKTVARDVDIERTEIDHDEVEQRVIGRLVIERLVSAKHVRLEPLGARHDVAIEFEHRSRLDQIARRIEVVEVPQHVATGVANLAIRFRHRCVDSVP